MQTRDFPWPYSKQSPAQGQKDEPRVMNGLLSQSWIPQFPCPPPHTLKEQGHLNSRAASPICFRKSFDQAWLQPGILTLQGCVLCEPFKNTALHWSQVLLSKMFHTSKSPHLSCLAGTHDGTSWFFWDTAEIPSHASKQVTVSKPMSSRKTGHWHKQLPTFLFWLELISALLCKGIKLSRWGNLESPTLDGAGRERQTFCLEK